jgi:hypothetical protein
MVKIKFISGLILSISLLILGCNDQDSGSAKLRITMVDAPAAAYDEVNVEVMDILVHTSTEAKEEDNGWRSVITEESKGTIYNLLSLVNGEEALLADTEFPTGKLSQIRLVLGENNSLKIGDEVFPLTTPSAQQSGLKLQVNEDLREEFTYNFILDFDAAASIVATGAAGKFNLKPVIRCTAEENSGAIEGIIALLGQKAMITATSGEFSYTSYTDEEGGFLIKGVKPGTYQLTVDFPENETDEEVEEIEVKAGEITKLGALSFAVSQ